MANNKLENAINAFKSGMSCYAAAIKFDIPRSTLRRKIKEAEVEPKGDKLAAKTILIAAKKAKSNGAKLTPEMMEMLVQLRTLLTTPGKPKAKRFSRSKSANQNKPEVGNENAPVRPTFGGTHEKPEARVQFREGSRFIITSAQNNTALHEGFWASMATWCAHNAGELLVSTFAYNKNGWSQPHRVTKSDSSLWYAPELTPHICNVPTQLANGLLLCGQAEISPTARNPLRGFEDFTRASSGIFPHTQHAAQPMPALKGKPERTLYTTGACTLKNYIPRRAGQIAEFDHIIGALVVEITDDGTWFVRQINANEDGSFQDLRKVYGPNGITEGDVAAVTWADWHIEKEDQEITEVCLGEGGILDTLRPREQHHHDLLDFMTRNHHNIKDIMFLADMFWSGSDLVEDGMRKCARLLEKAYRPWSKQVLMVANHCSAFAKWLNEAEGYRDPNPDNQIYWLEWRKQSLLAIKNKEANFDVFERAVRAHTNVENVRWLRQDESYEICNDNGEQGIECSIHGHEGVNGAKGSARGYRGLGVRINKAHEHSAGIYGGTFVAGVNAKKDMTYNKGPGSWSHTQIITYANGKRTLIAIKNGQWCAQQAPMLKAEKPRFRVQALSQAA